MALPMKFTFLACDDLGRIWDSIAMPSGMWSQSPAARTPEARQFVEEIKRDCALLAENPDLGRDRGELQFGMRSLTVGRCKLFYRVRGDVIEVVRVLPASRDIGT